MAPARRGAVILGEERQIHLITPVAADMLGWRTERVKGLACPLVFDCRDGHDRPMCDRCGFAEALLRQEITHPRLLHIADAFGGRRRVALSFWYLPPTGNIFHPRVMAILEPAPPTAP